MLGTYQYNFAGNVVASTDANGGITEFRYDPLGQLTAVINAKKEETKYTYDQLGQMIRITYPDNNTTQKKYDELGRLIQTTDATGKVEKLYYDGNNNQIRATDRNGTELSYVYDARNFLIEKKAPDETIRYAYDLAGRRTRMTDNTGTTQYTYQPSTGQLSKVVYPDGKTLTYDYNALGLRSSLNDPFGQNTYYQYDSRNRLSSVSSSLADEEAAYSYYRNDLIKQTKQRNGITTAYTYNGLQLQTLTHKQADETALNTYAYEYDANENETAKTENGQTYQFGYDPLNRITSSSQYRESYAYDARGNRTSFQTNHEANSPDADYVYDKKDRLSAVKLKDGSTVSYKYNGDGLLYERTDKEGTARYYYDGDQVIAEGDGSGSLKARYVRGRELVARESGGSKAYYLHNGHGDVVELRSETGTRLNQYTYDIWGNPTVSEENISNPFRYSGEYWDSATKLQYLRARWYDPSMGRFINEDTYEGQLDNPLSLNLYTYVMNNPLKYTDPSGHCFDDSLACRYINKMKQATVDAMQSGVDAVYGTSKAIADFMFLDDLRTVTDENASNFDKGLAAAGFVPWGKIVRSGKLIIQMGNKAGKYIERASNLTDDNLKYAEKLAWNCNCFVAGTKVQTDEGEKNIEDIQVGDKVLSKNEETGEVTYKEVTATFNHETDEIYNIRVNGQTIESTFNHPFYVKEKGWTFVKDLKVGDLLVKSDGNTLKIDSIELVHKHATVYNMTVDEFHTYFVSDLGIWVHNTKKCYTDFDKIKQGDNSTYKILSEETEWMRDQGMVSKGTINGRKTWFDGKNYYQWDSQHGRLEMWDKKQKNHLGEFDAVTGERTGDPIKSRRWGG
ncbi:polymorphic toxin-type HINT domain-containing protein [Paenibacillus sp. RC84]|uniref:polymorphic toxin-type HINT domain-containing protein n=1 Tax=Paenibacillus sp. RC84 TaxID=3156252 RepID=UPI00351618D7